MKTDENIDQLIKETLTQEEAKFYDDLDEKNILGSLVEIFNGKNSWIVILMNIVSLGAFGLFVYCVVQFFNTDDINELIKWVAGGFIFISMSSMIKLYMWMQVDKNRVLNEIKRIEILISSLSHKISE
ncbi:DUF6768 family protein [Winogradskyella immobilis]|uniref:Holin-X, holin superfamily III n=1 Tax=Winogradskyella immobilis TaxID=2816852 RepID=A0ABS8EKF9_9FLAO|nr:DUF6768 family protein [Winogradskyella immobilis]MCC1483714.1 hypothetical protein [Winogradskyella immobilis]MCG0015808.1 hypothetical protein [Winogradskyella immobilis]